MIRVLAVDLGATSVRVAAVDLSADRPRPEILRRFEHGPVEHTDGTLRWDWPRLVAEVEAGLEAGLASGAVASIGVDGWAVDYGLLDADGELLTLPFSYRDARTDAWQRVADDIGRARLYELTGIQLMGINTIFQLAAHDPRDLARAAHLLLLPDLLIHHLTGAIGAERSNASTTALVDARRGAWSPALLDAVDVDPAIMPPLVDATTRAGTWRGVPVHVVGSHDTASAFVARPGEPEPGEAFVSAGTWVLVGTERARVDTADAARAANFSNEGGTFGDVRFLRNVVGFWLLEQCRTRWGDPPIADLVAAADGVAGPVPLIDAMDERFVHPEDMDAEIRVAAGLGPDASRAIVVRSIVESIAATTTHVLGELAAVTGTPVTAVQVVGGGARLDAFNRALVRHTGLPVTVGSAEASTIGNAVVQGIALGRFASQAEARRWVGIGAHRLEPDEAATP